MPPSSLRKPAPVDNLHEEKVSGEDVFDNFLNLRQGKHAEAACTELTEITHQRTSSLPNATSNRAQSAYLVIREPTTTTEGGELQVHNLEGVQVVETVSAEELQAVHDALALVRSPKHSDTIPRQNRSDYRADVDGLRAVAVVAVMIYHMDHHWLPGGFVGVDVFFVISGFVVSGTLLRSPAPDFWSFLLAFYARRVKRLVPALLAFIFMTSIAISAVVPPEVEVLQEHYISGQLALLGWSNNFFAGKSNSYWDVGAQSLEYNPFTHTWSLGVEEQFYFLFPTLAIVAYGPRASRASYMAIWKYGPLSLLALSFVISLVLSAVLSIRAQQLAFYLLPSRFWQLVLGAMLFEVTYKLKAGAGMPRTVQLLKKAEVRCAIELCSLILAILASSFTNGHKLFPVPWSILAIAFAVSFIGLGSLEKQHYASGLLPSPVLNSCLGWWPFAYIGRLSYPLYLWHWPVYVCLKWVVDFNALPVRAFALLLTTMLAMITYHGIELRVQSWKPRRRIFIFLVFLVVGVGSLQLWIAALRGPLYGKLFMSRSTSAQSNSGSAQSSSGSATTGSAIVLHPPSLAPHAPPAMPPLPPTSPSPSLPSDVPLPPPPPPSLPPVSPSAPPRLPKCACMNNAGPDHTLYSPPQVNAQASEPCFGPSDRYPTSIESYREYFQNIGHGCFATVFGQDFWDPGDDSTPDDCFLPGEHFEPGRQPGAERTVFMLGDSHAAAFAPGLAKAVRGNMAMAMGSGPSFMFVWSGDVRFSLLETVLQKGDVVLTVQAAREPGSDANPIGDGGSYYGPSQLAFFRWALIPMLQSKGGSLVLFEDVYRLGGAGDGVNSMYFCPPGSTRCDYTEAEVNAFAGLRPVDKQRLQDFAAEFPETVRVFDRASDLMMAHGHGSNMVPGTSINAYVDSDHVSIAGGEYFAPYLCAAFDEWGLFEPVSRTNDDSRHPSWLEAAREALATYPADGSKDVEWCERAAVIFKVHIGYQNPLDRIPSPEREGWTSRGCDGKTDYLHIFQPDQLYAFH